jgi:hypothetical protein
MKFLDLLCIFFTFMVIILFAINFKIKSSDAKKYSDKTCIAVQNSQPCWSDEDRKKFCLSVNACK